ncbi:hypothetical protein FRX31_031944 [Thalictrum thalictroides]|uniref:Uncharacterized protein n=1 Tax=Thalictrum thalictroides TaxID=46969 RepID=A0A7J6V0L4_THATH|nr:hypothetical protein FRX31_031944 [Thalictrum thalictroides]
MKRNATIVFITFKYRQARPREPCPKKRLHKRAMVCRFEQLGGCSVGQASMTRSSHFKLERATVSRSTERLSGHPDK